MKLLHQSPLPSALPAVPPRGLCRRGARKCQASGDGIDQSTGLDFPDPEAKYRRYGKHFGGRFKLDMQEWVRAAPRVRVRTTAQRQVEDLLELAVVNERLAGRLEPWEARARLEYIKRRRRNWEAIYDYVTARDVEVTLDLIEEANIQVRSLCCEKAWITSTCSMDCSTGAGHTSLRLLHRLDGWTSSAHQGSDSWTGRIISTCMPSALWGILIVSPGCSGWLMPCTCSNRLQSKQLLLSCLGDDAPRRTAEHLAQAAAPMQALVLVAAWFLGMQCI